MGTAGKGKEKNEREAHAERRQSGGEGAGEEPKFLDYTVKSLWERGSLPMGWRVQGKGQGMPTMPCSR